MALPFYKLYVLGVIKLVKESRQNPQGDCKILNALNENLQPNTVHCTLNISHTHSIVATPTQ